MNGRLIHLLFAFTLPALPAVALGAPPPTGAPQIFQSSIHNAGLLDLQVSNVGIFGGVTGDNFSARWRGGEYLSRSGIWIGAIGSDLNPHVSAAESVGEFGPDPDPSWTIYESFENIKNGKRGFDGDDDADAQTDEDFHNGLDDDGDGKVDEDFEAIGQQMFSAMYRDDAAAAGHFPLGLLVRQRSIQWSVSGIDEIVGLDFEVINTGEQQLREIYLGYFSDCDVGPKSGLYWNDDQAGWDVIDTSVVDQTVPPPCSPREFTLKTVFMWDTPDNGIDATSGDVPGVFGSHFLGHTKDDTGLSAPSSVGLTAVHWFGVAGPPATDLERYQLMASGTKPDTNPRPGVAAASTIAPADYRYLMATGPFHRLYPGESLRFQVGLAVGEGFSGFRANAVAAQRVFDGLYIDLDQDPDTGIEGRERCLRVLEPGGEIVWDDPCDTLNVAVTWRSSDCLWVDADCDPCTGINGQEHRVTWVGSVAPPSPATNLNPDLFVFLPPGVPIVPPAGDGIVTLQWDNSSELWKLPFTGVQIFEGYRIWKVDGWLGGPVPPARQDFIQIAEFRLNPEGGLADPTHLRNVTNRAVEPVGQTGEGQDIYPIGRYEYADTAVVNNDTYFYAITAFGLIEVRDPITLEIEIVELAGTPASPLHHAVIPGEVVPVRLLSFTVGRDGARAVLRWAVADAVDHAGFHVHRQPVGGERVRITESLLAGGPEYEFVDAEAPLSAVQYWLEERGRSGSSTWLGPVTLEPGSALPNRLGLGMAVPNPFTTQMQLAYTLPDTRPVRASVFDLRGRRVRILVDVIQGPGEHTLTWQGDGDFGGRAAPGFYIIRLEAGGEALSRKVLLMR